jgi:histidinol dehydrogenase
VRIVRGLEGARRVLCDGRGLDLDSVPPQVQERTNEVYGEPLSPLRFVERVLSEVRERGDEALRDLTRKLDGVDLGAFEVPSSAVVDAYRGVPAELVEALELAAGRIRRFHEASLPKSWVDFSQGYGELFNPVERVGVYVPGGTARFPSTVLMAAIPARVAGVQEIIVATPSGKGGSPHPVVLAAADIAGVDRIFQISGAQAIAAMAYGTETVPRVDMVCGPGNVFVTLAKKLVFGEVGIDGLYGPTETLIIADGGANPTLCAADLVAQAEHDYMATPVLITTSEKLAESVRVEAELRAAGLERASVAKGSLERRGCIAVVENLEEAFELANQFAPEHISLMVRDPWDHVGRVRNAGAVFLGELSHEVLGDYVAGPSHVMPTGATARFSSGLGVRTFLKVSPVVGVDKATSSKLGKAASIIARAEGFTGHAEAAEIRDELR